MGEIAQTNLRAGSKQILVRKDFSKQYGNKGKINLSAPGSNAIQKIKRYAEIRIIFLFHPDYHRSKNVFKACSATNKPVHHLRAISKTHFSVIPFVRRYGLREFQH